MPHPQPKASTQVPGPSHTFDPVFLLMDEVSYIRDAHRAYEALEQLITPTGSHDREQLEVERTDLGALLRLLNRGMRELIDGTVELAQTAKKPRL